MELLDRIIYTNSDREEQGIFENFEIDVDVADQKDFEIKMPAYAAVLDADCFWFVQNEEYGGIVDQVDGDTDASQITYKGRNTRGILASRFIELDGNNSKTVSGYPADIFNELFRLCGLDSLFVADEQLLAQDEYLIEVINYQISGYRTLYDTMISIADSVNSTIKFYYSSHDTKWHVYTELIEDFSDYLNYCQDNSIQYRTQNIINAINHLICTDDAGHVIPLFTDKFGGVQKYTLNDNPIEDADYILDKRNQLLFGVAEYEGLIQQPEKIIENYKIVANIPADWANSFSNYFYLQYGFSKTEDIRIEQDKMYFTRSGEEGNYIFTEVQSPTIDDLDLYYEMVADFVQYDWFDTGKEQHVQVTSKPADWDTYELTPDTQVIIGKHYYVLVDSEYVLVKNPVSDDLDSYYEYSGGYSSYYKRVKRTSPQVGYEYKTIEGTSRDNFRPLGSKKPDDWKSNFTSYYYKFQTGTGYKYRTVQGKQRDVYVKLTKRPGDWATNYDNYFVIKSKKYTAVTSVKKKGRTVAPDFRQNKYYRKDTTTIAPSWSKNYYYWNDSITTAPNWSNVSDNVWKLESILDVPAFLENNTYEIVKDHYQALVQTGLNELEDLRASQKQEVSLSEFDVDIGDIVGGVDDLTGYTMCEPVTNMIAKLNYNGISIEYIVGGKTYE